MRLRSGEKRSEDESSGLIDRVRDRASDRTGGRSTDTTTSSDSTGWFGRAKARLGLAGLLVVGGLVLLVFPEPITSTAGVALIVLGALLWLVGRLR